MSAAGGGDAGRGAEGGGPGPGPRPDLDRELREGFAALRRQEKAAAPGFSTLAQRTGERAGGRSRQPGERGTWGTRRVRPLAIAAATAAVAGAALVLVTSPWLGTHAPSGASSPRPLPSITAWRPATDFLLRTPGREILAGPPAFGRASSIGAGLGIGRPGRPGSTDGDR